MRLNMEQADKYRAEMVAAREAEDKAKRQRQFNRLQLAQTKDRAKLAKADETLRAFCDRIYRVTMREVDVMPAPDCIYASVRLSPLFAAPCRGIPDDLGLKLVRQEVVGDGLGAPVLRVYRHGPVMYYVTEEVR